MNQIKLPGVTVLVAFALSAIAATAAHATEGPVYRVEGKNLTATQTAEIIGSANGNQVLKAGGSTITCTSLALKKGATIEGQGAGSSDTSLETIEYSGCTVAGTGFSKCVVTSVAKAKDKKIVTQPVRNTLAYATAKPVKGTPIYVLFEPVTPPTFVNVKFEIEPGGKCLVTNTNVEGNVAAEASSGKKPVKVEEEPAEAIVGEVNFPKTPITEACTEKAKVIACTKVELLAFGLGSTLEGKTNVERGGEKWGVFTK